MAVLRGLVRLLRRLAVAGVLGAAAVALALAREGMSTGEWLLFVLLLAAPVVVLFFAQAVNEVAELPERVRRVPGETSEQLSGLSQVAQQARTARLRNVPGLLWRLRGSVGGVRGLAGIALPLRAFTPGFVTMAAISAGVCLAAAIAGVVSLLVLAVG
jgi:FtsH-binding integral membrane protein